MRKATEDRRSYVARIARAERQRVLRDMLNSNPLPEDEEAIRRLLRAIELNLIGNPA